MARYILPYALYEIKWGFARMCVILYLNTHVLHTHVLEYVYKCNPIISLKLIQFLQVPPQDVVYADLDFSRQEAFGSRKKLETKKPEPVEAVVYSEVRPMASQEKQQLQDQQDAAGGDGNGPSSPSTPCEGHSHSSYPVWHYSLY